MMSAWLPLLLVVLVLALIPLGLKWLQQRMGVAATAASGAVKLVSVLAVGPHQRVVMVEVGPEHARVWLTLGVTAQSITCLYTSEQAQDDRVRATQSTSQSVTTVIE